MGKTWDACSLAALALCLGCGSSEGKGKSAEAETAEAATTSPSSTATGSGGMATGSESTGADSGGTTANTGGAGGTDGGASDTSASSTSTSGAGTGGQVSWPHTETHACLDYVLGFCEQTARCDGATNVLSCYEANSTRCPDLLFAPGSTRTIDGTFACADEWRALSCEIPTPECATAGTLADGEACVTGIQCASRLCSGSTDLCGSCMPSVGLDEPCDDALGPQCTPGLLCDPTESVCVALSSATTEPLELGAECDSARSDCYPNDCRADDAGVYRCQPYPTLGQDCSDPLTCAFGDSYCDITQVCLALPAVGDPCGVDGFTGMAQWCADGLFCDQTAAPAVCGARPGVGEPCEGACQDGLRCNCADDACTSLVCQRSRLHGESCAAPEDACLMGDCVEGSCVVPEAESIFAERCAP